MNDQAPSMDISWEETIRLARSRPEFAQVLHDSYLGSDIFAEAERFAHSIEFAETLKLIREFAPGAKSVLDIGAGTGISSYALSRAGYEVTSTDPDPSGITGCGAIRGLQEEFRLEKFQVVQANGEELPFPDEKFDVVYIRQAMHHATDLNQFIKEAARVLKPGGFLFTIRDHVIFDEIDKQRFLSSHPFQKYYGGENAFTEIEYLTAFNSAGLTVKRELKYFDSPINYFPMSAEDLKKLPEKFNLDLEKRSVEKFGAFGKVGFVKLLYRQLVASRFGGPFDERRIEGRMYSFVLKK